MKMRALPTDDPEMLHWMLGQVTIDWDTEKQPGYGDIAHIKWFGVPPKLQVWDSGG